MPTHARPSHESIQTHHLAHYYGVPPEALTPQVFERVGKIILKIVGGDGALSEKERTQFLGSAHGFGAPEEVLERYVKFDHRDARLEELIDASVEPFAHSLLYDAIRIARTDGFDDRERSNARKAARLLGLDASIVSNVEALLIVEDAVRAARIALLWGPKGPPPAPATLDKGAAHPRVRSSLAASMGFEDHARRERYGLAGPMPHEFGVKVGKAIMVIAMGDGAVSQRELLTFLGNARATGAPPEAIEEFLAFDPRGVRVTDVLDDSLRPVAGPILYEALTVARADGLDARERSVAVRAAKLLGLEESVVHAMAAHLGVEEATRLARIRILTPE